MIYAQHNFAENYASADSRKDEFMKEQIVIDELARLLTTRKNDVVKLLRKNGINATFNDTTERITELVLMLISQNDQFVIDLKKLIIENHINISSEGNYSNAASDFLKKEKELAEASKGLSETIKKLGNIRRFKTKGKKLYANADDLLRSRVKLADAALNKKPFPKWAKWTLISLGVVAIIGATLIIIRKLKTDNSASLIPTSTPPVETTPPVEKANDDDSTYVEE